MRAAPCIDDYAGLGKMTFNSQRVEPIKECVYIGAKRKILQIDVEPDRFKLNSVLGAAFAAHHRLTCKYSANIRICRLRPNEPLSLIN